MSKKINQISLNGKKISSNASSLEESVKVSIVGKYIQLQDAYKSLDEAIYHAGLINKIKVNVEWVDLELLESSPPIDYLDSTDAILVPGGFGQRGSEGKINAIRFAREKKVLILRHLFRNADGHCRDVKITAKTPWSEHD